MEEVEAVTLMEDAVIEERSHAMVRRWQAARMGSALTPPTLMTDQSEPRPPTDHEEWGHLPMQLVERYVGLAVRRSTTELLEDGSWYAAIQLLPGVWASGSSEDEALAELRSVTEDWVLFKIEDHDGDIPVLETIDLNNI